MGRQVVHRHRQLLGFGGEAEGRLVSVGRERSGWLGVATAWTQSTSALLQLRVRVFKLQHVLLLTISEAIFVSCIFFLVCGCHVR